MRGLSFRVGNELFAVDVTRVQKMTRKMLITPVPTAADEIVGITNLKGKVVTVFSLNELLGREETFSTTNVIVFKSSDGENQTGLLIEKPGTIIEIDDEKITQQKRVTDFFISGIAETNGKFYRIVDVESILNKFNLGQEGEKA